MFNFGTILVLSPKMKINSMKFAKYLYMGFCLVMVGGFAQTIEDYQEKKNDSSETFYYIIEGDSIPREFIDLEEVILLNKIEFNSKEDRRRYLILRRKTKKVYPYAKLASERLTTMTERLKTIKKKRYRKRYTKRVQRQTGRTAFELVKELRTGWRAFWYNSTAKLFEISIKERYRPFDVKEDYLIEDILERSFQSNILERQKPAFKIDYLDLTSHWNNKNVEK